MKSVSPVFTEKQASIEYNVAPDIIGLPVAMQVIVKETGASRIVNPWGTSFRFRLNDEERAKVAAGADLILTEVNYGNPITPTNVQFCMAGETPYFGEGPNTVYSEQSSNVVSINKGTYPDGRSLNDGASDGNSIYDPPMEGEENVPGDTNSTE